MKLIDADKLIEMLGTPMLIPDVSPFEQLRFEREKGHNYCLKKVINNIDDCLIDLSKFIDEEKIKKIIRDVDYDCFGSKITHGKLHTLMANAIVKNINKCLK